MIVTVKLGGDPTLGHRISIHNFGVPYDSSEFLKMMKEKLFPGLEPLEIQIPLTYLPSIKCCACNHYFLPVRSNIEQNFTLTHIHSSLQIYHQIFLLCRKCAEKIKEFIEQQENVKRYA